MKTRNMFLLALAMILLLSALALGEDEITTDSAVVIDSVAAPAEQVVVTYFHGDVRCATCKKLEAYSHEAIVDGFGDQLKSGQLVWRTVNYDKDDNKHYIDDYKLYTKALILSKMKDTVEVDWANLEKIWSLVGNKDDFIKYVQTETGNFMMATPEPEAAEE